MKPKAKPIRITKKLKDSPIGKIDEYLELENMAALPKPQVVERRTKSELNRYLELVKERLGYTQDDMQRFALKEGLLKENGRYTNGEVEDAYREVLKRIRARK